MKLCDRSAMVFAAGLGNRMQPLTANCPKPLLKVGGRSFLERALDHIYIAGLHNIIVNAFYFPEKIKETLELYPDIHLVVEHERLETGGGAKNVLSLLGREAFFTLNGDVVWQTPDLLGQLHHHWNSDEMDALLLLMPIERARGSVGRGDFIMSSTGQLERFQGQEDAAFVYTGCQLIHPRLFAHTPRVFSVNTLYDNAIQSGRLYGHILEGDWFHLSTPEDLANWGEKIYQSENQRVASGGRL